MPFEKPDFDPKSNKPLDNNILLENNHKIIFIFENIIKE